MLPALQTASLHPTASFPTGFCSLRVAAYAITIHHASLNKAGSPLQGRRRACLYPQPPARQPRVLQPCHRQPGASPAARSIPGRRRWLRGIKGCVGCVGGAETGEPGWLLSLIRLCSAMDLGPTGQASSLSARCKQGFQQYLGASAWSVQADQSPGRQSLGIKTVSILLKGGF